MTSTGTNGVRLAKEAMEAADDAARQSLEHLKTSGDGHELVRASRIELAATLARVAHDLAGYAQVARTWRF